MHRRQFFSRSLQAAGLLGAARITRAIASENAEGHPVRVTVDSKLISNAIPKNFIGLGYEISSVATQGLLSSENHIYVQLVRTLGPQGVIRIGGNTSDFSSFSATGASKAISKGTVVNERSLQDLGTFLGATGWHLIWGLNLGGGTEQDAIDEAKAVMSVAKDKLLAFEIGNEPDLFGKGTAHRPKNYQYADYIIEYRRYKEALRRQIPNAPFAGPDAASATDWVTRFAADEGNDLKLLTHHYYRECASPTSTLDKLLYPDPKLQPILEKLKSASASSHVPYRICETNSFCGGGKPGVSDTLGSALWALDFMFILASADAGGVNLETGVNQLDFISSYSPIGDDEHGVYSAKPEYYAMLAFAHASQGRLSSVSCDTGGINLAAYAVSEERRLAVTLINKDETRDVDVNIAAQHSSKHGGVWRLTGPSLGSKEGVMLAGAQVDSKGNWQSASTEKVLLNNGECRVHMGAGSAAVVIFEG
ncbi:MAG: hypothetical protein M3Y24_05435 [Acidobacteriota bacterium]|nr:hypothetical protein [Acidobacteriota bacterium]